MGWKCLPQLHTIVLMYTNYECVYITGYKERRVQRARQVARGAGGGARGRAPASPAARRRAVTATRRRAT